MKYVGYGFAAIVAVAALTLLYLHQRGLMGRTDMVEQRTGALEERAEIADQRAQSLEQQTADTQQRTAQLERGALDQAARVDEIAGEVKQSEEKTRRIAQQLARLEKQAPPADAAALAQDLTVMSSLKVGVVEYYMTQGRWPSTNAEVGLPAPEQYHGDKLRSAAVLPDGVIEMKFARSGSEAPGIVRLVADAGNEAMGVRWRCESPNFPDIGRVLSACHCTGQ